MKTTELSGAALDWAVAMCEGGTDFWHDTIATYWITLDGKDRALRSGWAQSYLPSTDWSQGGPIIERELIDLHSSSGGDWTAEKWEYEVTSGGGTNTHIAFGPTPLIAAMRCFVASRLGDEVEIPEELK